MKRRSKNIKNRAFCRRVARHGLIFGGTEAHHLQEAFARPPGPPGPQKQTTNRQKNVKNVKIHLFAVFLAVFFPYFSFKGRIFLLFGVTAVVIEVIFRGLPQANIRGK